MKTKRDRVVLVDENDRAIGIEGKLEAHQQGLLHRAFSAFIFNDRGELLLQQRAFNKYHGAGLWTNTCCSHPQWQEDILCAAKDRLDFEMGLKCSLKYSHAFTYKVDVENGLIEHEYDHVFVGYSNQEPIINTDEVQNFKWCHTEEILNDIRLNPLQYTKWFKMALPTLISNLKK